MRTRRDLGRALLAGLLLLLGIPGMAAADSGGEPDAAACTGQYLAFYAQLNPGIPLGQLIPGPGKGAAVVQDIRATVCTTP